MKIWIILEADHVDYSRRWGYGAVISYTLSQTDAEKKIDELNGSDGQYYYDELEINPADFMPTAS